MFEVDISSVSIGKKVFLWEKKLYKVYSALLKRRLLKEGLTFEIFLSLYRRVTTPSYNNKMIGVCTL